jgi:hypothetical protein
LHCYKGRMTTAQAAYLIGKTDSLEHFGQAVARVGCNAYGQIALALRDLGKAWDAPVALRAAAPGRPGGIGRAADDGGGVALQASAAGTNGGTGGGIPVPPPCCCMVDGVGYNNIPKDVCEGAYQGTWSSSPCVRTPSVGEEMRRRRDGGEESSLGERSGAAPDHSPAGSHTEP